MLRHVISRHIIERYVMSGNSCLVTYVMSCHVTSRYVYCAVIRDTSRYVMSCHIIMFLSGLTMVTSGDVGTFVSLTRPAPGLCHYYVWEVSQVRRVACTDDNIMLEKCKITTQMQRTNKKRWRELCYIRLVQRAL